MKPYFIAIAASCVCVLMLLLAASSAIAQAHKYRPPTTPLLLDLEDHHLAAFSLPANSTRPTVPPWPWILKHSPENRRHLEYIDPFLIPRKPGEPESVSEPIVDMKESNFVFKIDSEPVRGFVFVVVDKPPRSADSDEWTYYGSPSNRKPPVLKMSAHFPYKAKLIAVAEMYIIHSVNDRTANDPWEYRVRKDWLAPEDQRYVYELEKRIAKKNGLWGPENEAFDAKVQKPGFQFPHEGKWMGAWKDPHPKIDSTPKKANTVRAAGAWSTPDFPTDLPSHLESNCPADLPSQLELPTLSPSGR